MLPALIATLLAAQQPQLVEFLRIGVVEGEEANQLFRVGDIDATADEILVVNGRTEIRVYGWDGVHRRTFGGEGSGPAEFRNIREMRVFGDSVFVEDANLRKLEGSPTC